ncbi:AMP-dependent synthetase/ligase [Thermostichus vulcanus]|uniref:AMP-binding protein n=1 Tax=Thermostichus vulcanus str. 'Rupite' TaxID=2813851 RepID=A0ABT0C7R2_THEVL|nr:AMP-binding protein [Thermostichus vulcanus]MCJ2541836.1 AMP-binding protein [Thermostichus vulcanus str. 'Rupite']
MTTAIASATPTAPGTTLLNVWQRLAEQFPQHIALRDPHVQPVFEITYSKLFQQVQTLASGLQALGIRPGDRVALIADNSPRWLMADLATMFTGAVNVPRSAIADPEELGYILRHSGSTTLIVQDLKTLKRIQSDVRALGIERVLLLSDEEQTEVLNFSQWLQKGRDHGFEAPRLERSQLATIIYTSGTSGRPKGVMLSHGNLMHQVENLHVIVQPQPGDRVLTILPTWHSYERACEYFLLSRACTLVYTNPRFIKQDFKQEAPHFLVAVPRIWETVYDGIQRQFNEKSALMQRIIRGLIRLSERYVLAGRVARNQSILHYGASPSERLRARLQHLLLLPLHKLGDLLIYKKVRQALGPNFQHAISGGGSLPAYLDLFYEVVGISILNGYGLTETSPVLCARRPEWNVRGTAGPPLPGTEFRILDPETRQPLPQGEKGLITARGPQVMMGYYNNPEATAKVLTADGWFDTGDLGWLTPDGQLVITGRAKDTIVLSNGENIEPQPLEDVCLQCPYISQIVVVGQDQKKLAALIYPNLEALQAWATEQGIPTAEPEWLASPQVRSLILEELRTRIQQRPGYRPDDQIGDFRFLPEPLSVENGLMTQTLKIKRNPVAERYAHLLKELYPA